MKISFLLSYQILFLASEFLQAFHSVTAAKHYLASVYDAGGQEVTPCLNPQRSELRQHLVEGSTHRVDGYIAVDAERRREQP